MEAETEVEVMLTAYWLISHGLLKFFFLLHSVLSKNSEMGHSTSIIKQPRKFHTLLHTGNFFGNIFTSIIPSSQIIIACVKLT